MQVDQQSRWLNSRGGIHDYEAQFDQADMDRLIVALEAKSRQVAAGESFAHGEPLKVLQTSALHCGF